jgi:hypothetical protein
LKLLFQVVIVKVIISNYKIKPWLLCVCCGGPAGGIRFCLWCLLVAFSFFFFVFPWGCGGAVDLGFVLCVIFWQCYVFL